MKHTALSFEAGPVVAFLPNLVKYLGSVQATLFFCQFLYWTGKGDTQDGTYKTIEDIQRETGLTRTEQQTARKNLRALGVLRETRKHLEHRTYYKLDLDRLAELVAETEAQAVCDRVLKPVLEPSEAPTTGFFEKAYDAYPGEKNWHFAAHAWQQMSQGVTEEMLLAGVLAYADYVRSEKIPAIPSMDYFVNNSAVSWAEWENC